MQKFTGQLCRWLKYTNVPARGATRRVSVIFPLKEHQNWMSPPWAAVPGCGQISNQRNEGPLRAVSYKQTEFRKRCSLPGAGPPALCCPAAGGVPQVLGVSQKPKPGPILIGSNWFQVTPIFLAAHRMIGWIKWAMPSIEQTDVTCATAGGSISRLYRKNWKKTPH